VDANSLHSRETQLRSKLKKWKIIKKNRRQSRRMIEEKNTSTTKLPIELGAPIKTDETSSNPQDAPVRQTLPAHNPQTSSGDWRSSESWPSSTGYQSSSTLTGYDWGPGTNSWKDNSFAGQKGGISYENHNSIVAQNDRLVYRLGVTRYS
jgi:hypothetical protein